MDWNRELFVLHLIEAAAVRGVQAAPSRGRRGVVTVRILCSQQQTLADVYDADGVVLCCCDFTRKKGVKWNKQNAQLQSPTNNEFPTNFFGG